MVAAKSPSLEMIQIASPCTANWDDMVGDERMRHCGACNLNVFNLSNMTRNEATAFLAEREGRSCVRMFKRADGTVITRDCPVGIAALRAKFVRLVLNNRWLAIRAERHHPCRVQQGTGRSQLPVARQTGSTV